MTCICSFDKNNWGCTCGAFLAEQLPPKEVKDISIDSTFHIGDAVCLTMLGQMVSTLKNLVGRDLRIQSVVSSNIYTISFPSNPGPHYEVHSLEIQKRMNPTSTSGPVALGATQGVTFTQPNVFYMGDSIKLIITINSHLKLGTRGTIKGKINDNLYLVEFPIGLYDIHKNVMEKI